MEATILAHTAESISTTPCKKEVTLCEQRASEDVISHFRLFIDPSADFQTAHSYWSKLTMQSNAVFGAHLWRQHQICLLSQFNLSLAMLARETSGREGCLEEKNSGILRDNRRSDGGASCATVQRR
jgi:hypothetical protein